MKKNHSKSVKRAKCVPVPCKHCSAPLFFAYEGTISARIGCICNHCLQYVEVDISVKRAE